MNDPARHRVGTERGQPCPRDHRALVKTRGQGCPRSDDIEAENREQTQVRLSMNPRQKREQAPRTPNAVAPGSRSQNFAQRLECVQLAGAFGSWSRRAWPATWRLLTSAPTAASPVSYEQFCN